MRIGHCDGHWHRHRQAQVQFTAKRVRSFIHIAAQSHAVAVTSALSNDGARPSEKTPGCESNQACLIVDAGRGATQLKNHAKEDAFNGRRRSTWKCWRTACSVGFSVQEAGGCPLKAARRKILKPRGFVHWAHAGALCANVIVVEAFVFAQDANARAFGAAQTTCYCRVFCSSQSLTRHTTCDKFSIVFTRFLSFVI